MIEASYACADCEEDCASCLWYEEDHALRPYEEGEDPFDFPCSQTWRDYYEERRRR